MAPHANHVSAKPLIAVDIGNSRIKLGLFHEIAVAELPTPARSLSLDHWDSEQVQEWLRTAADDSSAADSTSPGSAATAGSGYGAVAKRDAAGAFHWRICSVNRPSQAAVLAWLAGRSPDTHELMTAEQLPLVVEVERPDLVGMDRLASAIGANRLRRAGNTAIVVDVGSAITVDLITSSGAFAGGAILPGIAMSARAMHDFTDLLPLVPMSELDAAPAALGASTIPAMRSGLFWGAVGAMRELVSRLGAGAAAPQVFLTGGAASAVASLIANDAGEPAAYVPHLTLGGIALAESRDS